MEIIIRKCPGNHWKCDRCDEPIAFGSITAHIVMGVVYNTYEFCYCNDCIDQLYLSIKSKLDRKIWCFDDS